MAHGGYQPCSEGACPANMWALHAQMHSEDSCGETCPTLACMDEHRRCNNYLFHAIRHFVNVPQPEVLLRVLLRRTWLPTAYPTALEHLWQVRTDPKCQAFDIKATTEAILQAAPAGYFLKNPTSLVPAIERACQPTAGTPSHVTAQIEAAALLLKAYPAVWQPGQLSNAITQTIAAKPPPNCTTSAAAVFHHCQTMLLILLLNHCHVPTAAAGATRASFMHGHIKTALVAGAQPVLLELLLSRATHWRPNDLHETDAQGMVVHNWARETSNYTQLFSVIVRAAVTRGATHQLVPALMYLAQPFQRGMNTDRRGYEQRIHYFLQALAAPDYRVTPRDLLPVVKEAASTGNVQLLLALAAASNKFRWPAAQLAPLLTALAGGVEEYDVAAAKVLLQLGDGFSPPQMAQAVAAAADRAKAAPYLEARGLTQRMCDQLCAGGNWDAVAATAVALNLPAAAALLRKLYSASGCSSKTGSAPANVASAAMAAAAGSAARPHTGVSPGQQQAPKPGLGQGVVGSAVASAVVAAAAAARAQASWSAGHGGLATQVATAAPAAPAAPNSDAGVVALVVPPVATTAGKPPLSPVIPAGSGLPLPPSPQPMNMLMPAAGQALGNDPAATARHSVPPPPNKTKQQHQPLPSATARQPGQAAAVAYGGSLAAAPRTLEPSPSAEMLAIAAATLATFKDGGVASLHHNSTNGRSAPRCRSRPAPRSPAAASPRSSGRPVHEMHLNPNMSAAQCLVCRGTSPGQQPQGLTLLAHGASQAPVQGQEGSTGVAMAAAAAAVP
ncbi:hypothetical protein COO60DRAFT_987978 [Scenedesmus sp. NREL 46B-D3]|nr:hypothetical protein COO60DRAFT_987978 [Scenedesmus sp. NREL 46B-D3]